MAYNYYCLKCHRFVKWRHIWLKLIPFGSIFGAHDIDVVNTARREVKK